MIDKKLAVLVAACALALGACGQSGKEAPAVTQPAAEQAAPAVDSTDELASRLASDARSAEDRARDAGRKPLEVLAFFDVKPGMHVIDVMAAGGWYSEVLSLAVGPEGSVTAQNPPFILAFRDGYYKKALAERIGDRLKNVTELDASWMELAASGARYDFAMSALNLHDTYLQSPEASAEFASAVFAVLKPGAVFGVIDHVGNAGTDYSSLHRIDKATAINILTTAGFVLEDESDLLANPDDDHTQAVFSESIRGRTDRFVLKLRKPTG